MHPISPSYGWENGVKQIKITEKNLSQSCVLCQLLRSKTLASGSACIKHFSFFYHYLPYVCRVNVIYLTRLVLMARLDIWCSNSLYLKNQITKIEQKQIFCGPSKIFKNGSWPINICLKYFMTPTKTLCPPSYILNVQCLKQYKLGNIQELAFAVFAFRNIVDILNFYEHWVMTYSIIVLVILHVSTILWVSAFFSLYKPCFFRSFLIFSLW